MLRLKPYKIIIDRWLRLNVYMHPEYSVSKAKKPISDYQKASGLPEGVAELTVYYCEQAISFSHEVGLDDGVYYDALVRMLRIHQFNRHPQSSGRGRHL